MAIGNFQHINRDAVEDGESSKEKPTLIETESSFLTPPSCCQLEALVTHWLDFVHEEQPDFERSRVLLAGI
jgi:hypothetical protein